MNIPWPFALSVGVLCFCSSCATSPPGESALVLQRIPIEIQSGKPITVEIRVRSSGGQSEVGIRCPPEVWKTLTNGNSGIKVRLLSSNTNRAKIATIPIGYDSYNRIKSMHDLFYLNGMYRLFPRVTVEITFPAAPAGTTHAEILVCRMATDSL
jgi:hypothetical protein